MQAKLTLRLEEELIKKAKRYAAGQQKSLSKMVADFFQQLTNKAGSSSNTKSKVEMGPITRSLAGCLKDITFKESEYYDYLEKKYR